MRRVIALVSLGVLAGFPLAAQSNAERILSDRYSRSHDYDLLHQRIELSRFDWDSLSFEGRVGVALIALRPAFDSIVLDAGKLLRIQSVSGPRGTPWRFASHGDSLVVYPERPAGFRDTVRFTVTYQGRVENGRGLTFIEADSTPPVRPRQLWSQGEDMNNHCWFPTCDFPNDRMSWDLVATVPTGFTVVSNGRLAGDRKNRDGTHTVEWRQERPAVTYLVSLIVAPLVRVPDKWRDLPVDAYVYRQDSALARPLFKLTPNMIEVYARLTGVKYPWAKYAQTTVADFFGGEENVSASTLVDWLPDARAYADRPWYLWELIPHELAHQWFGDYVTTANWANMWLNEGFATFLPGQYWLERQGPRAEEDYYLTQYDHYLEVDQRHRMPLASLGSNNIYPKGALVLEMLKRYLGAERFWASLHRYLTDHALGVAVSEDLRRAVLDATGENLDWFWDQWIYQAGYPEFQVTTSYDSSAGRLSLLVRQTQTDSSKADSTGLRFTVPSAFRMPATIRVGTARGEFTRRIWLTQREQTIQIDSLPAPPTMVVFDDGNQILKRLEFRQPTAWLVEMMRRTPDLWNRRWAIGQLAALVEDTTGEDSLAVAALREAARSSDYFQTRVDALEALGAAPYDDVIATGEAALNDSSAQVRAAAVQLLGSRARPGNLARIREVFDQDSSYQVRAAALGALRRAPREERIKLIASALATPSYREVIQSAAIWVAGVTNETTVFPAVADLLGRNNDAGYMLAALAVRKSKPALDLLVGALNDDRPRVRRAALHLLTRELPMELVGVPLREAVSGLTRPDVRQEVMKALLRPEPADSGLRH